MQSRTNGIIQLTPAGDYSGKEGYGVTIADGVATLSGSATVPIDGIILEGGTVAQGVSVAIPGAYAGALSVKLGGAVPVAGSKIVQNNDGTFVVDPAAGARVQIGLTNESGALNELVEAFPRTPVVLA